ncbi:MAG: hypothetical protein PHI34_05415 [Acidobacteriota bacterium]|nr:hypothetical protein [Acidobacteriota bacterium]
MRSGQLFDLAPVPSSQGQSGSADRDISAVWALVQTGKGSGFIGSPQQTGTLAPSATVAVAPHTEQTWLMGFMGLY